MEPNMFYGGVEVVKREFYNEPNCYCRAILADGDEVIFPTEQSYNEAEEESKKLIRSWFLESVEKSKNAPIEKDLYAIYAYLDDDTMWIDNRYLDEKDSKNSLTKAIEEETGKKVKLLTLDSMTKYND